MRISRVKSNAHIPQIKRPGLPWSSAPQTFNLVEMEQRARPTFSEVVAKHKPYRGSIGSATRSQTVQAKARQRALTQQAALHRAGVSSGSRAPPRTPSPTLALVAAQTPLRNNLTPVYDVSPTGERIIAAIDLNGTTNFGPDEWTPPDVVIRLWVAMLQRGWIPFFLSHIPTWSKHRESAMVFREDVAIGVAAIGISN